MADDYLKTARERSLEDDSTTSEAELHSNNEAIRDSWQAIQDLKAKISKSKKDALKAVNDQYADELKAAQDSYALTISLSR